MGLLLRPWIPAFLLLLASVVPPFAARANPVITEFMADNTSTLLDEDGDPADWIELHNPDPVPVDLEGWHLTDDPARPTQWRFPARMLAPGAYLVVFASGKNRTPAAPAPLHTNFRLAAGGEYLGLIAPDGTTLASGFSPTYPRQEANVSYGIPSGGGTRDLLAGSALFWRIPTSPQELPSDWPNPAGPPGSGWRQGAGWAVGFDTSPATPGGTNLARLGAANQTSTGFGFGPELAIDGDLGNFTHTSGDDDQSAWSLDLGASHELRRIVIHNRSNCCQSRLRDLTVTLLAADGTTVVWSSGLLNPENILASPPALVLDFDDLNLEHPVARHLRITRTADPDLSGSGGQGNADEDNVLSLAEVEVFGVESVSFAPSVKTDLAQGATAPRVRSAFVVAPFVLEAAASNADLRLRVRYDDGLIVHLNGEEIARFNAPPDPAWDSLATGTRSKAEVLSGFRELDLRPFRPRWVTGTNWLAFQVLNQSPDDPDLFLDARLEFAPPTGSPGFVAFLDHPSPGAPNPTGWNLGRVADTKFSVDRGLQDQAFNLEITTATPGATIRYTRDGSVPTETTGLVYAQPIPVTQTTIVRAAAFKPDHRPSNVDTQSYLFPADVPVQGSPRPAGFPASWAGVPGDYAIDPRISQSTNWGPRINQALRALPSLSIVTSMDHLFGASAGIYANPERNGIAWERPISLEWIDPSGQGTFQAGAGLRIQGGYFRQRGVTRKHSLRLLFKDIYGPGKLRQDFFHEFGAAREFDTLVLRAGANDGYSWDAARDTEQFLRDEFGRRTFLAMGQVSGRGRFVHVYLNGLYWGLYNLTERPAEDFSASYFGGNPEDWDAVNAGDVKNGSLQAWNSFLAGVRTVGSLADYQRLKGLAADGSPDPSLPVYLDAPQYIDYMIVNLWGGNWDWPNKNFWFGRDRTGKSGGFKFYVWDFENTMGNNRDRSPLGMLAPRSGVAASWVGEPHDRLRRTSAEYRMEFADRLQAHFFGNGALTPGPLRSRYQKLAEAIEDAVILESARWGDDHWNPPQDPGDWARERDWILGTYLPQRSAIVLDQFRAQGLYPRLEAPEFSPGSGSLPASGSVEVLVTAPELVYTTDGTDPRLPGGTPRPGATRVAAVIEAIAPAPPGLVRSGQSWRYLADGTQPGGNWKSAGFDDSSWPSGPSPLGYGDNDEATVVPFIDTLPTQSGTQKNATTFFRTDFTIANPTAYEQLQATLTYDDAGAVYLNGTEILRTPNLPPDAGHTTFATATSADNATLTVTALPASLLHPGTNVLAVEIHQADASSSDISFDLDLTGLPRPVPPRRLSLALGPAAGGGPVRVLARARNGDEWSALVEATFTAGSEPATASNLALTKLHYHPAEPGTAAELAVSSNRDDFEFLELLNTGASTLDLTGVRFIAGILYDFPDGRVLGAGQRLVLAGSPAAFAARYGAAAPVLGPYQGRLDNNGEEIALVDAVGRDIVRFRYSDAPPWPEADGTGYALVLRRPKARADLSLAASWRQSTDLGARPGASDTILFTGDPTADLDANGRADLLDHAFGTSPDPLRAGLEIRLHPADPEKGLKDPAVTLSHPVRPGADDVAIELERAASALGPWESAEGDWEGLGEAWEATGGMRRSYRLRGFSRETPTGFLRLRVVPRSL